MTRKKKLLFISLYSVILAAFFEGASRVGFGISGVHWRLFTDEDYSWRREWVQRHKKSGSDVTFTFDKHDSTKGWISKPNLRDMQVFENKILNTNSRGFRGKRDFSYGKDKERFRIVILGDSYTFGEEVSDDETYSHFLQEMLPQVDVINLAVHGYGHDQMLILLKEEGVKYEPDMVLLGFLPIDMSRNLINFRDFAKPRFVVSGGQLELTGSPVPHPEDILKRDWVRPRVLDLFANVSFRIQDQLGIYEKKQHAITTAILSNMVKVVEGIRATPVFAYLPNGGEITSPVATLPGETYMFSLCQSNPGAKCFSTRPVWTERIAKGEKFRVTGHWDPGGHRAVAEAIRRFLADGRYLSAP